MKMSKKQRQMARRIGVSALVLISLNIVSLGRWLQLAAYLALYIYIGGDVLRRAWKGIASRNMFNENFLMAVATIGAFALAIYSGSGDYNEAIAVMLFYQIGEFFQGYAVSKSRQSISDLMEIRPDYANVEQDGQLQQVDPEEVAVGTIIVVQPGERIPIDGEIVEGSTSLDTRALTGESLPREAAAGDRVTSGCINLSGLIKVKTLKPFGDSTVAKILELVEESGYNKAKTEEFIARFARYYTPVVCYSALALALLPPLVRMAMGLAPVWSEWIYRSLIFLVISCPCALVISVPLSFFAGIGGAGREGILIKGANFMEVLAKVDTVVYDKTGTLTKGEFAVSKIEAASGKADDRQLLLEYAALAECASSHPVGQSLVQAYGKTVDRSLVGSIENRAGYGIAAVVDGHQVLVGSAALLEQAGISCGTMPDTAGTLVMVAIDQVYAGYIVVEDEIKPEAADAITSLRRLGIKRQVMLTGDREKVAGNVVQKLGLDKYFCQLLPADKVQRVEELLHSEPPRGKLAFVGDGINDAPVLTRVDVGIAMGAMGADAAIEAADVVLMDDNPGKLPVAVACARRTMGIVYQNIVFALGIKIGCMLLGALGLANLWMAIFADVGVLILAVLNAVRALHIK